MEKTAEAKKKAFDHMYLEVRNLIIAELYSKFSDLMDQQTYCKRVEVDPGKLSVILQKISAK